MTALLEKAFEEASKLPSADQDLLANWILMELEEDDAFDQKIALTAGRLAVLSQQALEEDRAGETQELDLGNE